MMTKKILLAIIFIISASTVIAIDNQSIIFSMEQQESGTLFSGIQEITFRIYNSSTDGVALYSNTQNVVFVDGRGDAVLPNVSNFSWSGNRWVEIQITGNPVMSPRLQLHAAPDAITNPFQYNGTSAWSKSSSTFYGINTTAPAYLFHVAGSLFTTKLLSNDWSNASLNASQVSGLASYLAGTGLQANVTVIQIQGAYALPQECSDNQIPEYDNETATWGCTNDDTGDGVPGGNCPAEYVVQNVTGVGVQCVAPLFSYAETDPLFTGNFTNIIFVSNTTTWDKDTSDDLTTSGGAITGNLVVNGNLTVIGALFNATVANQYLNGSFLPSAPLIFDIGASDNSWNNGYYAKLYSSDWTNVTISESQVTGTSAWDKDSSNDLTTSTSWNGDLAGTGLAVTVLDGSHLHSWSNLTSVESVNVSTQFGGDVTGTYDSLVVVANSTTIGCANITGATSNLCVITDTDTKMVGDGFYLYNDSTTIYLNETLLNATIDVRDSDTTYTNSTGLNLTETTFSILQVFYDNWNEAYDWGDHGVEGYLTSYSETDPYWSSNESRVSALESSNTTTNARVDSVNETAVSKASSGDCATGQVVMNTTSSGVQCVAMTVDTDTWNTTAQMIAAVNNTGINIGGNAATVTDGIYTTSSWAGGDLADTGLAATVNDDSHLHAWSNLTDVQSVNLSTTFAGDVSGNYSATVVSDDSHLHSWINITGILSVNLSTVFGGDVSGNYSAIVVSDNSHLHNWANLTNIASVNVTTQFGGDVSGTYNAIVVAPNSTTLGCANITSAASNLCTITSASDGTGGWTNTSTVTTTTLNVNTTGNLTVGGLSVTWNGTAAVLSC